LAVCPACGEDELYNADLKVKSDPFKPFIKITKREAKTKGAGRIPEENADEDELLIPPLQRFGVEEFRLVGIILGTNKKVAIVEDMQGKSYPLIKGTSIGMNNGRVVNILSDQIIVLENMKDIYGKTESNKVILKLEK
jgi:Tfp pilus assembly protein PilP